MSRSQASLTAAANKAVQTRRKLKQLTNDLRGQGYTPDVAEAKARKQLGLKLSPQQRTLARTTSPSGRAAAPPATPAPTATPASSSTTSQSITQRLRQTAAVPDPADPNDPVTSALRTTAQLVQPTWKNDGKWLTVWTDKSLKKVQLPVEPKPGPFTPTEVIHDVLGQQDLLFLIAVAISEGENVLIEGPTGTAKTTAVRWFCKQLNWNCVTMPCTRGTEEAHMIGEYLPHESKNGAVRFSWTWGQVSTGVLASQDHPTILCFEELNRVGSVQVFARLYSLLDDTKKLVVTEKRDDKGKAEELLPGKLYVAATQNPVDTDDADYIGVQQLDAAFRRRFQKQREIGYPPQEIEAEALRRRVKGLALEDARKMVAAASQVRQTEDMRFPFSFPDLVSWATGLPYYGWDEAAEVAVVSKAHPDDKPSLRDVVALRPTGATP